MINTEVAAELAKKVNEALEQISEDCGELVVKIDIVQIKKKTAILKIDIATKDGKVIAPVNKCYVMAGDTINLTFAGRKLKLKDVVKFLII